MNHKMIERLLPQVLSVPMEMIPDGLQFQARPCHILMQPASLPLWGQPSHTVAEQPSLAVSFVPWITEILAFLLLF